MFTGAKIKCCIVIDDNDFFQEKITFKVCDGQKSQIGFKHFLNLEKDLKVLKTSKTNWKRELFGVKFPHRVFDFQNCQNDKMCRSCIIDPKLNCFDCEISKPCDKCLKTTTQIKLYFTEVNKLKRQPPDKKGNLLPHYVGENIVEEEERDQTQISYGKCNKCFVELNHDNSIKKRELCRSCYNQTRRN